LESNSVVFLIEEGVVLSHEDISKDEVVEAGWEDAAHYSQHALGNTHIGYLENVVISGQDVVSGVNGEGDIGKILNTLQVLLTVIPSISSLTNFSGPTKIEVPESITA